MYPPDQPSARHVAVTNTFSTAIAMSMTAPMAAASSMRSWILASPEKSRTGKTAPTTPSTRPARTASGTGRER